MKDVSFQRVGLFAKVAAPTTATLMPAILDALTKAGVEVLIEPRASELAPNARSVNPGDFSRETDLVIVVGGDGSLLSAARAIDWAPVPITGINLGRLGFLADISPPRMEEALHAILHGDYTLERRLMLQARIGDTPIGHACNDVVIKRLDGSRLLEIEAWIDDAWVSRTRADGLIVATPTGSTAYALSAGGPILAPGLQNFALVPISPHSLGERPVVIPADRTLRLRPLLDSGESAEAVLDGQVTYSLAAGDEVFIERSSHELLLLHPPGYEYFATLREKLGWGGRAPQC
ncbi:MAG: NAD(+)/NADH kinase [Gammaproteobacteria bacterium]